MNNKKTIFLVSNGSCEKHSDNTLTKFTNTLPTIIETPENEKYEVAVESIGFSCLFRNIKLPENDFYPSFMLSNCMNSLISEENCADQICSKPLNLKYMMEVDDPNCYWYEGKFSEKYHTEEDLTTFFNSINREYNTNIKFVDGYLEFGREAEQPWYWVLVHPTLMETFGFESRMYLKFKNKNQFDFKSKYKHGDNLHVIVDHQGTKGLLWEKKVDARLVDYHGHLYFAFKIGIFTSFLKATKKDISQRNFPRVVKVQSENIEQQIFNSSFSNDMVVFCPDFVRNEDYYFHEFEYKQYVPVLNSTIKDFEIKLCDEDNYQLQLLPGVPTILKVDIRTMSKKRTFNVRLTSIKNKEFRDNKNYHFKVKLPNVLSLDKTWRVSLTSISHPNTFKTFLPHKNNRGILVRQSDANNATIKYATKIYNDTLYTVESIVFELKEFFNNNNFGEVSISEDNKLTVKFAKCGSFVASNNLLRVLGYSEKIDLKDNATQVFINRTNETLIVVNENSEDKYILKFGSPINLDFLKPNYMIAYTNFVESSIIGGVYSKILRVIPLINKEKGFVINEFKHNEYLELQNTDLSEIEIVLRSHDGEYVNFGTQEDVILNLEFTNSEE